MFDCPRRGLLSVLDNKAREQQRDGRFTVSHNALSRNEVQQLFKSRSLSRDTPSGFLARLVFNIGLLTGMGPTAMSTLSVRQIRRTTLIQKNYFIIQGAAGSASVASKTSRGSLKAVGHKPQEVAVFDEAHDELINFYKDIRLFCAFANLDPTADRFFLAIKHQARDVRQFWKRQPLGKNTFPRIIRDCCVAEDFSGSGERNWITTHRLRGTLATLLFETNHSDSSVAMRNGHRDPRSLKRYQRLRRTKGTESTT